MSIETYEQVLEVNETDAAITEAEYEKGKLDSCKRSTCSFKEEAL